MNLKRVGHKLRYVLFKIAEIFVDECALGTDNCDVNADCTDTDDAFYCTCKSGYTGNGVTCTGRNE